MNETILWGIKIGAGLMIGIVLVKAIIIILVAAFVWLASYFDK
jgi:hypothetical protein